MSAYVVFTHILRRRRKGHSAGRSDRLKSTPSGLDNLELAQRDSLRLRTENGNLTCVITNRRVTLESC
jgi:hypothetical protein